MRVLLQHTCSRHAMGAVSCSFVCLPLSPSVNLIVFSLPQRSHSNRCQVDTTILAHRQLRALTCACATSSRIHSYVHVTDARDQLGVGTTHSVYSFQLPVPGLTHLPLAGQTMCPTAQRYCLLAREFPVLSENLTRSILTLVRRFPNPIPAGTSLQRWTLLDITVRFRCTLLC